MNVTIKRGGSPSRIISVTLEPENDTERDQLNNVSSAWERGVKISGDDLYAGGIACPNPIVIDQDRPAPFGVDSEAYKRCDWLVIEAAFITRWNAAKGTISARCHQVPQSLVREFQERANEPGWLADAEKAIGKFPLKCLTGGMRLATFLQAETVAAILNGNYDFDPKERGTKPAEKPDTTQSVIQSEQAKFISESRKAAANKEQARQIKAKWSERAEKLTDAEIRRLAGKYPGMQLTVLKQAADESGAHKMRRQILVSALCKCLELESQGTVPA